VNVRLPSEPESLHPMLSNSSYGVQISGQIMLPAAEFDPLTLQLSPLLINEVPEGENVTEGKHTGGKSYKMEFRPEATWDDGSPVTAADYLFTLKTVLNPHVSSGWKGALSFISEVVTDPSNPKALTVYIDSNYIWALESVTNFFIYPEYAYDPGRIMAQFRLDDLRSQQMQWTPQQDSLLKKFAEEFQSTKYLRENISGAGAYALKSWQTGEFISLERKKNWWADKVSNPPLLLQAYPHTLNYHIITDAASAEAALKSGMVDVVSEFPSPSFVSLRDDPQWKDNFHFETPEILQIYIIDINHRDPVLADENIRKALAYSLDYDGIMKNLLAGLGQRAIGPIHPKRNYYHKDLQPIRQDINKAIELIKESGWEDTNQNGTPDKMINGKREELTVTLKVTNKEEGQMLASIMRENAKKAGIDVVIETVETNQFNQDVRQGNYDLVPLRLRAAPSIDEPFQSWHSKSDQPGGGNKRGYHSAAADKVIDEIRTAETTAERDSNYYELQEILYEEQPVIFLYVPLERIAVSKKFDIISSSRKPGYFENLFRLAG
jgi:peptide/nickel transport system substrate-binding protein